MHRKNEIEVNLDESVIVDYTFRLFEVVMLSSSLEGGG